MRYITSHKWLNTVYDYPVCGKYIGRLGTSVITIEIAVLEFGQYYLQFKKLYSLSNVLEKER